jgi:serine/threonine protein kinase
MTAPGASVRATDLVATVTELIVSHGWGNQTKISEALAKAKGRHAALDTPFKVLLSLFEQGLLSRDQLNELDGLLQQQANFPNYRLVNKLGAGGMGTVYLANHLASGRKMALKTIIGRLKEDSDFVGRFHRESKVLIGLHHRNIAEVFESGESNGVCYMAMEHIRGPSLASLLRQHQVLPELYVLRICHQVAEGLAYVYDKAELVHRDIKPENVLIARDHDDASEPFPYDDVAKLIDFGLVKPVDDDERLTQTGMTIGTPLYMSPEQIRGEKIDCRSDIYGLAATMYHLLTGVTPFTGTSPGSIMSAHLTQDVPDPGTRVPSLHPKTRELVMMAMAKRASDRFLTFEGFLKALDEAISLLDEKHSLAPRLLRKPLVLKGPVRKNVDKQAGSGDQGAGASAGEPSAQTLSSRIVRKFKDAQNNPANTGSPLLQVQTGNPPSPSARSGQTSRITKGGSPTTSTPAVGNAADALRVATTSTFKKSNPTGVNADSSPDPGGPARIDSRIASAAAAIKPAPDAPANKTTPFGSMTGPVPVRPSAVFDEDPETPLGTGIVPWIVLGIALIVLVVWWLLYT